MPKVPTWFVEQPLHPYCSCPIRIQCCIVQETAVSKVFTWRNIWRIVIVGRYSFFSCMDLVKSCKVPSKWTGNNKYASWFCDPSCTPCIHIRADLLVTTQILPVLWYQLKMLLNLQQQLVNHLNFLLPNISNQILKTELNITTKCSEVKLGDGRYSTTIMVWRQAWYLFVPNLPWLQ